MRVYAFHLLNDYSGSPKVLGQLCRAWVINDVEVHLTSSFSRKGFLSDIEGVRYHNAWYRFYSNKLLRLFALTFSQLVVMIKFLFILKREDIVYVNTVLPFGAALAGKLVRCRVVYHLHETIVNPPILKKFLFGIIAKSADDLIFVSKYVADNVNITSSARRFILYNAIEDTFVERARQLGRKDVVERNILMVCSLKVYKGVLQFMELAKLNQEFKFRLVLNSSREEIDSFFEEGSIPSNVEVFDTQTELSGFYHWADLLLNLSRPDGWIETFGLTVIEAMAYGIPSIVPPVGGIAELIDDGVNGYKVDSREIPKLDLTLKSAFSSETHYRHLAQNAFERVQLYREASFIKQNLEILKR